MYKIYKKFEFFLLKFNIQFLAWISYQMTVFLLALQWPYL